LAAGAVVGRVLLKGIALPWRAVSRPGPLKKGWREAATVSRTTPWLMMRLFGPLA
jgi:hypothetical protein